jgi:hypothetical protein
MTNQCSRLLTIGLLALSFTGTFAFAGATAQDKADAGQIDSACSQDAQTAGCSGEVVGKGLLKCLHAYRKAQRQANKGFHFSPGCEAAMHQLHADREAGK